MPLSYMPIEGKNYFSETPYYLKKVYVMQELEYYIKDIYFNTRLKTHTTSEAMVLPK